jgi:hypothetical protein
MDIDFEKSLPLDVREYKVEVLLFKTVELENIKE